MALSNRLTTPLSVIKPAAPTEEDTATATNTEQTTEAIQFEPVSEQATRPFKALATIDLQPEFAYQPDPAELNPSLFASDADTNPYGTLSPYVAPNPNPLLPAIPPVEMPLYLRNPGPPPKLPRNRNVKSLGRTSYRFQEVKFGYTNRRALLYACAVVGIILLFVVAVVRPQDRKVENKLPVTSAASYTATAAAPTATRKPTITLVPDTEQFAVVSDAAGFVLENPQDGATQIQNLSQYTYIAFQRKSDDGWYQLKGGTGWIKASSVKVFPTEKAAWDYKNAEEAKIKG